MQVAKELGLQTARQAANDICRLEAELSVFMKTHVPDSARETLPCLSFFLSRGHSRLGQAIYRVGYEHFTTRLHLKPPNASKSRQKQSSARSGDRRGRDHSRATLPKKLHVARLAEELPRLEMHESWRQRLRVAAPPTRVLTRPGAALRLRL
jgi:hypothetical protein